VTSAVRSVKTFFKKFSPVVDPEDVNPQIFWGEKSAKIVPTLRHIWTRDKPPPAHPPGPSLLPSGPALNNRRDRVCVLYICRKNAWKMSAPPWHIDHRWHSFGVHSFRPKPPSAPHHLRRVGLRPPLPISI
jgi:hypothetical protein